MPVDRQSRCSRSASTPAAMVMSGTVAGPSPRLPSSSPVLAEYLVSQLTQLLLRLGEGLPALSVANDYAVGPSTMTDAMPAALGLHLVERRIERVRG